jgi:hypothetical protein
MLTGLNHLTLAVTDVERSLASRLAQCREAPYAGMRFFE